MADPPAPPQLCRAAEPQQQPPERDLAALQAAAESQMRRPAPSLGTGCGGSPGAKRQRRAGDEPEPQPGSSRFAYAADLLSGRCACFVGSCSFKREKSASKELLQLLRPHLPGRQLQLVKVGCSGIVLVAATPLQQPGEQPGEQAGKQPGEQPGEQPAGAPADGEQRDVQPVAVVTSLLGAIEAGRTPRTKFCERVFPAEAVCLLTAPSLRGALQRVVASFVARHGSSQGGEPLQFAVQFKSRGASDKQAQPAQAQPAGAEACLDRQRVIELAAAVMQECARGTGGAKANLKEPQVVLMLEALPVEQQQVVCCLAALPRSLMTGGSNLKLRGTGGAASTSQ